MSVLNVKNIIKSFDETKVLRDISFSLEKGESLAILGSSGSGKTTLLRCLNFLEDPDGGEIYVNDKLLLDATKKDVMTSSEKRKNHLHFGLVFQAFHLFPQYTALKNVTLACELLAKDKNSGYNASSKEIVEEAKSLLKNMGLEDKMNLYPHQLSGGQQQRVAIARALAVKPDILCFDEPTSALDPELTGEVLRVIKSLADQKTTMIIVTHEISFAREVADRILFMDDGVVVEEGNAKELIDNPKEERTKQFLSRYTEDVFGNNN